MGILSTTGSKKPFFVKCSLSDKDPLKILNSIQKIFNTDIFENTHNSWLFTLSEHNIFCISTNDDGLFELILKNGYINFYGSNGHSIKAEIFGKTLDEVFQNFEKTLSACSYCKINFLIMNDHEKKFEITIEKAKEGILRTKILVENFRD